MPNSECAGVCAAGVILRKLGQRAVVAAVIRGVAGILLTRGVQLRRRVARPSAARSATRSPKSGWDLKCGGGGTAPPLGTLTKPDGQRLLQASTEESALGQRCRRVVTAAWCARARLAVAHEFQCRVRQGQAPAEVEEFDSYQVLAAAIALQRPKRLVQHRGACQQRSAGLRVGSGDEAADFRQSDRDGFERPLPIGRASASGAVPSRQGVEGRHDALDVNG